MLIEFSVGNFRSFKEVVTFSMVAANLQAQDKSLDDNNTFAVNDKLRLLKSAAIYGANASGKTNLAKAMQFMREFVLNSSKETQADESTGVDVFCLSETTRHEPAFFQIVFLCNDIQYRYGFEATAKRVVSEWLFSSATTKEASLFQRDQDGIRPNARLFKEGKGLEDKTRDNALFLSVAAQFNGVTARQILSWFSLLAPISGSDYKDYLFYSMRMLYDGEHTQAMRELIRELDLSIQDVIAQRKEYSSADLPDDAPETAKQAASSQGKVEAYNMQTVHHVFDNQGNRTLTTLWDVFEHESEGTQKLIALAGPLVNTLKNGRVLFVDELDARLHPLITCAIIQLFNSQDKNPHNAQLIFATHDTNLLNKDLFRRDQIWFAEKDRQGATHLYSLAEFRGVRNDSSFETDYIHGKFGAIPFLGDFSRVFGTAEAQRGAEK